MDYTKMIKMLDVMGEAEIYEMLYDVSADTRIILDEMLQKFKTDNQKKIQGCCL